MANPLGQMVEYPNQYAPEILHPIPRAPARDLLGIHQQLPFHGVDVWTAFELSWLNAKGKPQVGLAEFYVPCESTNMVESKSFKLYLNSFNQHRLNGVDELKQLLIKDISNVVGCDVDVCIHTAADIENQTFFSAITSTITKLGGECIDDQDIAFDHYQPVPEALNTENGVVTETLHSHLLKSNCRITSQPDWASVLIRYTGQKINREGLLRYIVGFREHDEFHEPCVEKIFAEILERCEPEKLTVYARYTRRGGLDINPFRSNFEQVPENARLPRQ